MTIRETGGKKMRTEREKNRNKCDSDEAKASTRWEPER